MNLSVRLVIGIICFSVACNSARAQFGPPQRNPDGSWVLQNSGYILTASNSGRTVWGYSWKTGRWAQVKLDQGDLDRAGVVGASNVAIFFHGGKAYGFSASTGKWDVVSIEPVDDKRPEAIGAPDAAAFTHGGKAYGFSGLTGRWETIDLESGDDPVFPVGHAQGVQITIGSRIFMFSSETGTWGIVDLAKD